MTAITWSQIEAECGDYRAGFVATFRKYEGMETDEKDGHGRTVKVTVESFARHAGIAPTTFTRWVKGSTTARGGGDHAGAARRFAATLPAEDKAKLAAELVKDPEVAAAVVQDREAAESIGDADILHRAAEAPPSPTEGAMRHDREHFRRSVERALGDETDEATNYLNGAASDLGHAILAKEEWGIRFPGAEADALDKIHRLLAAYGQQADLTDEDRQFLADIGVSDR